MNTLIIVPAYNESRVIAQTLIELRKNTNADILLVDDGSTDQTTQKAQDAGVKTVRHLINLGLGAAIETGLEYARRNNYDQAVTFDADGQHNPKDIQKLLTALQEHDLVVGTRQINPTRMPLVKRLGNKILNLLTAIIFGVSCADTQSGLRALNKKAINTIRIKTNRYEVSSEILFEAQRNKLKIGEVPVEVIYTPHSLSRGTNVKEGIKILWRMIIHDRRGP